MADLESTAAQVQHQLATGHVAETERFVDKLASMDPEELASLWDVDVTMARHCLSMWYNAVGVYYRKVAQKADMQNDVAGMEQAPLGAERCHEKAFDMYDVSIDDLAYWPSKTPFNSNLILTFWGAGTVKYILDKPAESRKYLLMCLRFQADDDQGKQCQAEASHFLRLLDQKPVRIVLKAHSIMPNLLDPKLLQVEGELLEWGTYAKPVERPYAVYVNDDDISRLEAQGFRNAIALEGHTLILNSDASGDLRRPLRIQQVL